VHQFGQRQEATAEDLLEEREGDVVRGAPITAKIGKVRFEEAAEDLLNEYRTNGRPASTSSTCWKRARRITK
jgi:hypothetical protein